jgi:hypothetical protein
MQPGGVWRSGEAAWRRFLFSWLRRRSSLAEAMRAAVLWQPDGAVSIFSPPFYARCALSFIGVANKLNNGRGKKSRAGATKLHAERRAFLGDMHEL